MVVCGHGGGDMLVAFGGRGLVLPVGPSAPTRLMLYQEAVRVVDRYRQWLEESGAPPQQCGPGVLIVELFVQWLGLVGRLDGFPAKLTVEGVDEYLMWEAQLPPRKRWIASTRAWRRDMLVSFVSWATSQPKPEPS